MFEALLWIAAILTLITGYDYMTIGLKHMAAEPAGGTAASSKPNRPRERP